MDHLPPPEEARASPHLASGETWRKSLITTRIADAVVRLIVVKVGLFFPGPESHLIDAKRLKIWQEVRAATRTWVGEGVAAVRGKCQE